jgi:hypothetical protein
LPLYIKAGSVDRFGWLLKIRSPVGAGRRGGGSAGRAAASAVGRVRVSGGRGKGKGKGKGKEGKTGKGEGQASSQPVPVAWPPRSPACRKVSLSRFWRGGQILFLERARVIRA